MYEIAISVAKEHLFFRPTTKDEADILVSGDARVDGKQIRPIARGQHLACFAGGMVALAAKIFSLDEDLPIARKLVDGCVWAYDSMPSGIMPEVFSMIPCANKDDCPWDPTTKLKTKTRTPMGKFPGYSSIGDTRYVLRYVPAPLI